MPNWDNYYSSYDTETWTSSTSSAFSISYEEWQRERLQQDCIIEQQIRDAEERIEEQKKFPLFFWKQNCKPIRNK